MAGRHDLDLGHYGDSSNLNGTGCRAQKVPGVGAPAGTATRGSRCSYAKTKPWYLSMAVHRGG